MARKRRQAKPVDTIWEVPDPLWEHVIEPLLGDFYPPARTGRRRIDTAVSEVDVGADHSKRSHFASGRITALGT